MEIKQSTRIQTSLLNGVEKKTLVWMASRMPKWVTSDMLTWFGLFGSALCGLGFFLTHYSIYWLWLSCLGLVINWFGDSLDGSLARVHNTQRPLYGYYLDHNIDTVTEAFMFIGAGLSPLMNLSVALFCYAAYLALTVYVSINAHLKGEFRLTYIKLGPTEFRLIIIIADTLLIAIPALTAICHSYTLFGHFITMRILDYVAVVIIGFMSLIYIATTISDARKYAVIDPPKKPQKTTDE